MVRAQTPLTDRQRAPEERLRLPVLQLRRIHIAQTDESGSRFSTVLAQALLEEHDSRRNIHLAQLNRAQPFSIRKRVLRLFHKGYCQVRYRCRTYTQTKHRPVQKRFKSKAKQLPSLHGPPVIGSPLQRA